MLAERGMRVVVNYLHSGQAAEDVVAGIEAAGGQAMAVQADVRDPAAVRAMADRTRNSPPTSPTRRTTTPTKASTSHCATAVPGTTSGSAAPPRSGSAARC
jgi:NAD(P)-dependent dehydrogenase (short-subunit alcohol dehydrogenase family)